MLDDSRQILQLAHLKIKLLFKTRHKSTLFNSDQTKGTIAPRLLCPSPSCPQSLDPNMKRRPDLVTTAVCSSPQLSSTMRSSRIQNLEGTFSANLDLPKVKTAPVDGTSGSSLDPISTDDVRARAGAAVYRSLPSKAFSLPRAEFLDGWPPDDR